MGQLSFFNTIAETGNELNKLNERALSQQEIIFNFFRDNETKDFTPHEVQKRFVRYPITSVRRAMTNLERSGRLLKLNKLRIGNYGVKNYCWMFCDF